LKTDIRDCLSQWKAIIAARVYDKTYSLLLKIEVYSIKLSTGSCTFYLIHQRKPCVF